MQVLCVDQQRTGYDGPNLEINQSQTTRTTVVKTSRRVRVTSSRVTDVFLFIACLIRDTLFPNENIESYDPILSNIANRP